MSTPDNISSGPSVQCPQCKAPMQRRNGKLGPFWGCTTFPACKATLHDHDGKPSSTVNERYRCPICTRRLAKAEGEQRSYWYCTGYEKGCKVKIADADGMPELSWRCKACNGILAQRNSKHGTFWGCKNYPECTATYRDLDGEPDYDYSHSKG